MSKQVAPYGSWPSPVTAEHIGRGAVALAEPALADGSVWWIEGRPTERGRQVVVRDGRDVIPEGFSARARVYEYGGGAYAVRDGRMVFSNDDDGRVYALDEHGVPTPISPTPARARSLRYADFHLVADGSVYCVRESHETAGEPANELVRITDVGVDVVATGRDFYAAPRLSPDGAYLSFMAWDHPRMPWDGTELWLAYADGGGAKLVTGGPEEAIVAPDWSPEGVLHWISDRTGWWNLYRARDPEGSTTNGAGDALYPVEAEFAVPLWALGHAPYAFLDDGAIACAWTSFGGVHLGLLDPNSGAMEELELPRLPVTLALTIRSDGARVAYVGASPTNPPAVVVLDTTTREVEVLTRPSWAPCDPADVSVPRAIEFDSHGRSAHAFFYAPRNARYEAPEEERPPLLVLAHGGPSLQTETALSPRIQYWTSRGFAVVDVDYGGSTGYGRAYREILRGGWGVVDVEDCVAAALHLAEQREVDAERLCIRGGSAGGYTTLCALVFTGSFHAGATFSGVVDLELFAESTHKFESHYAQGLMPVNRRHECSPIKFIERISGPLIVFQGLEDAIVPPSQSELVVKTMHECGFDCEYHAYVGESHGFRKTETIIDLYERELAFYVRVLGLRPESVTATSSSAGQR
jgi:dipeptidyl aminopeptidase/acylaminoacyl peptidase